MVNSSTHRHEPSCKALLHHGVQPQQAGYRHRSRRTHPPPAFHAICRSAAKGEIKDTSVISPASTISFDTSEMRRIFQARSASVKPRSRFSPGVYYHHQKHSEATYAAFSENVSDRRLPDPDNPVNHKTQARWLFLRSLGSIDIERLPVDVDRRKACLIIPPAVPLVSKSIK